MTRPEYPATTTDIAVDSAEPEAGNPWLPDTTEDRSPITLQELFRQVAEYLDSLPEIERDAAIAEIMDAMNEYGIFRPCQT